MISYYESYWSNIAASRLKSNLINFLIKVLILLTLACMLSICALANSPKIYADRLGPGTSSESFEASSFASSTSPVQFSFTRYDSSISSLTSSYALQVTPPPWRGAEAIKHLKDYKYAEPQEFIIEYNSPGHRGIGYDYIISSNYITSHVVCEIGEFDYATLCGINDSDKAIRLNSRGVELIALEKKNIYKNSPVWGSSRIQTLYPGYRFALPYWYSKVRKRLKKEGKKLHWWIACITITLDSFGCTNRTGAWFVVEGDKITIHQPKHIPDFKVEA